MWKLFVTKIVQKILNRLKEPSTYAGLTALLVAYGIPADLVPYVIKILVSVAGGAAILLPEANKK